MAEIGGTRFQQFVEENREPVLRRIMSGFGLSEADAKDIYQESVVALFRQLDVHITTSLDAFFHGIWYRQALKFIRSRRRLVSLDMDDTVPNEKGRKGVSQRQLDIITQTIPAGPGTLQSDLPPDEALELAQMKERVKDALGKMAEQCRMLLTKYYIEGYKWAELAVHAGFSNADSVKAAANRCRRRFEQRFKGLEIYVKDR